MRGAAMSTRARPQHNATTPCDRSGDQWWAHLVGALRVQPHKHCADYPPQKIEDLRDIGAFIFGARHPGVFVRNDLPL
jgi:hypothetical protein